MNENQFDFVPFSSEIRNQEIVNFYEFFIFMETEKWSNLDLKLIKIF